MIRPKKEKANPPPLKAKFLGVVENQLGAKDPRETKETLDRLMTEGHSREDAVLLIAQAVCVEVCSALKHKQPFDPVRFVRNLKALPQEPHE